MEYRKCIARVLWMQLSQSKLFVVAATILAVGALTAVIPEYSCLSCSALLGSNYILTLVLSLTLPTAMHEASHLLELERLDYGVDELVAHRIGSVSFRIIEGDGMTLDESYQVARAPFTKASQYAVESLFMVLLVAINAWATYPLNVILIIPTALSFVSLLASFCCYLVIARELTEGFCIALARNVTSKGDVDEIVKWNKSREFV